MRLFLKFMLEVVGKNLCQGWYETLPNLISPRVWWWVKTSGEGAYYYEI